MAVAQASSTLIRARPTVLMRKPMIVPFSRLPSR
jgi:hypothetical protein